VHRDDAGIPHLWADSVDGLAYLQGRVAAEDRAWQLEVERARGEGRLARWTGPAEVPWDRFARRARLADAARRAHRRLDPDTRRWVAAYVDGVNAALPAAAARAPEFGAVGARPGRWRPWTPLAVFLVQHVLFGPFPNKLWRAHVAGTLGPAAVGLFAVEGPGGPGSNAWVVPGGGTGGAPLIAGDPHRVLELPGIYQQVRLACPEFDVAGLAFPGVPGVPHFGHAGRGRGSLVAWAVTHAMADYQDLYRERPGDARVIRVERVEVRGAAPVEVEVAGTPRGPVIDLDRSTGEPVSLRTPALCAAGDLGFGALLPLLRARTVADVAAALRGWVEPVNRVLVADGTGAVRQLVAGLVPVRHPRCRSGPVPGNDPRYAWTGWAELSWMDLTGPAVHANDRHPDVAPLGTDFAPPYRARRIESLLADGAAPERVHLDVRGSTALHRLFAELDPHGSTWDGEMRADSARAGAFAAWRAALARRLADHPCLTPLRAPSAWDELFAPWTDPRVRIGHAIEGVVAGLHRLGGDVRPVAVAALADVTADGRTWGQRHRLAPVRVPAGSDPAWLAVPLSGDSDCVLATTSVPGVSDACGRGPVARYVWDLGDRANSRWIVPFGASGRPDDPHFADQLPRWVAGDLIPVEDS
jgi:penicillin amidase